MIPWEEGKEVEEDSWIDSDVFCNSDEDRGSVMHCRYMAHIHLEDSISDG